MSGTVRNAVSSTGLFAETTAADARKLTDGIRLVSPTDTTLKRKRAKDESSEDKPVILPWMGYGTVCALLCVLVCCRDV